MKIATFHHGRKKWKRAYIVMFLHFEEKPLFSLVKKCGNVSILRCFHIMIIQKIVNRLPRSTVVHVALYGMSIIFLKRVGPSWPGSITIFLNDPHYCKRDTARQQKQIEWKYKMDSDKNKHWPLCHLMCSYSPHFGSGCEYLWLNLSRNNDWSSCLDTFQYVSTFPRLIGTFPHTVTLNLLFPYKMNKEQDRLLF